MCVHASFIYLKSISKYQKNMWNSKEPKSWNKKKKISIILSLFSIPLVIITSPVCNTQIFTPFILLPSACVDASLLCDTIYVQYLLFKSLQNIYGKINIASSSSANGGNIFSVFSIIPSVKVKFSKETKPTDNPCLLNYIKPNSPIQENWVYEPEHHLAGKEAITSKS